MTQKIDEKVMGDLLQAYMLEKYVRALENDLMFARFAAHPGFVPKPQTWSQKVRRGFAAYFGPLKAAVLGRIPADYNDCDCWEDDE